MNGSIEDSMAEMYLAHGTIFGLGLVMQIAFFVVALTTVRRVSEPASNLMVASSVLHFVCTLISPLVPFFAARYYGTEGLLRANLITTVVFGLLDVVCGCLLLAGIARLAEDRRRSSTIREP